MTRDYTSVWESSKGMDVLDKLCHKKSTRRKIFHWPLWYFFGILNAAAVNTFLLYKYNRNLNNYSSQTRMRWFLNIYLWEKKRVWNFYITKELQATMRKVLSIEDIFKAPSFSIGQKRKSYYFCVSLDMIGKVETRSTCKKILCGEHKIIIWHDVNELVV